MPQQTRFYSYNIIRDEQRDRLRAVAAPITAMNGAVLNTYSLYQDINMQQPPAIGFRPSPPPNLPHGDMANPIQSRTRRRSAENPVEDPTQRPAQRRRHRRVLDDLPPEHKPDLVRKLFTFKDKWNKMFPDKPCAECGTLLLPRNRKLKAFDDGHVYGLTRAFGLQVNSNSVIHCETCFRNPQPPVNVGPLPRCLLDLPQRSRMFLSPFSLNTSLGRTEGYNTNATPFTYRTLTGRIVTQPRNERAIALYSGSIAAWLESNAHNRANRGHNQIALAQCKDWLLTHNPVFHRNDIRAYLRVDNPFPVVHLENEVGDERRPNNRPDLIVHPFPFHRETRDEDYRHYRLPAGAVQTTTSTHERQPTLLHGDPDVEVLLFPHLYPHGYGQFKQGERGENGRSTYTRHMDVKLKLASINRVFREDWYWPSWSYQEIETTRIFQNTQRLINNKNRTAIDNRMPQYEILQQSNYGTHRIINETLSHTIPGSIRTGETYFQGKERLVNSVLSSRGLSTLFVTLTFNDTWPEFEHILRNASSRFPSDNPWAGVEYYYERILNFKNKFLKHPTARFGKLLELIERFEFQLRGAIHSHCLLWCEKGIPQLIGENYIRADIPDPDKEPRLHALVMKYQIHRCRINICGGPGANGKCSKGFPCDVSDTTHHEPGNSRYTYARGENDIWVSPYNPELLLVWEGHCNVQYVTSEGLAAYITKYVTKGEPLSMLVNNGDESTALQRHILARRIGSMEMMVLATGKEIFRSTCGTLYLPTSIPEMRNYTVRPPAYIEENPDDPYYPDAIEKYFARPGACENLTYFQYFRCYQVSKKRIRVKDGFRDGMQDGIGYWIYKRQKPILVQSNYRRLCDGESFFFVQLLYRYHWRSDDEIRGDAESYRARLLALDPALYAQVLQGQDDREQAARLTIGNEYLEMVEHIAEATPPNLQEMVARQLTQLNCMAVPALTDAAAISLQGDQYHAYTTVTQNIQASRHHACDFFVTGPGGTGKSFLLKSLQHWCNASRNSCLLLAPTGIAARNIDGDTIHSGMSIYCERGSYRTGLFNFADDKMEALKRISVLIIDEVSMVDGRLLDYISSVFARLKGNNQPFGNMHVIVFGDLLQLPPVAGIKVFKANVWRLFHPLFLEQPRRQTDEAFFRVLNKIRFGVVDEEVKELLTERWRQYNPLQCAWDTTYLCSLRKEADAMNHTVLSGMPLDRAVTFNAVDFENGERLEGPENSRIFKRGTNFPSKVICNIGAKVMFLTNSMLADKGIANGSIGVITDILHDNTVEAAFPTRDGIEVCFQCK
jgi:hypothetical protein